MKWVLSALVGAAVVCGLLTACSGGGSSKASACSAACRASVSAANQSYAASLSAAAASESATAAASPILGQYDTATCGDWAVTGATDRQIVAVYYETEFNDPQPAKDGDSLVGIITKACDAYGSDETPSHIAKVSIATVYGGN